MQGGEGRSTALLVVLLVIFQGWLGERAWSPVRNAVFDAYQWLIPRQVTWYPVIIVDIDDASLAAFGRWPWPRTRLARLIDATHRLGALAIGLNILMPEADTLSPEMFRAERPELPSDLRDALAKLPSNDTILAQTLDRTPSVVARAGNMHIAPPDAPSMGQTFVLMPADTPIASVQAYAGHITNIVDIEAPASGRGYLNILADADGVMRLMPLVMTVQGRVVPSMALELLRVASGAKWYAVHASRSGLRGVQIGAVFIPTEPDGRLRVYFSPSTIQRYVSARAILNGEVAAQAFAHHVAIIAVTAVGLSNVVVTPVTPMYREEVQAQVMENILDGTRLQRPAGIVWLEQLTCLVMAALVILWLPRLSPAYRVVVFLGMAALVLAGSVASFTLVHVLVDPSFPVAANGLVLVALLIAGFTKAERQRRVLDAALQAEQLARSRMVGELQAAREIQRGMLPAPEAIVGLPAHVEFSALLEPAEEVGGDMYDAFMLDEQSLFFLVGDVSGKGVPAALFMALSKTLWKSAALRAQAPLDTLTRQVNAEISRDNPAMLFVTVLVGMLNVRTGEVALCRAGHDAPFLLRAGEPPRTLDAAGGPPLCVYEDFPYTAERVQLQSGDLLLLITDGVTEAQDPTGHLYGRPRALTYLATLAPEHASAAAVCQGLRVDVQCFTTGAPPADDITILALRFTAPQRQTPSPG
jgi:serine phosphatase RsbU (regulator of sigma subunit)/CHASE2 domain-containing sensor protein